MALHVIIPILPSPVYRIVEPGTQLAHPITSVPGIHVGRGHVLEPSL